MVKKFELTDYILGLNSDMTFSEQLEESRNQLEKVLGNYNDRVHSFTDPFYEGDNIFLGGQKIKPNEFQKMFITQLRNWEKTISKILNGFSEVFPDAVITFSPYNGAETICAGTEMTIATDRLPIGSPKQIRELYGNFYAKSVYLGHKSILGYSFSGLLQRLGYLGAPLLWDIETIQNGTIDEIHCLDQNSNRIKVIDENIQYPGIEINYTLPNGKKRTHIQHQVVDFNEFSLSDKADILYLRGTEGLVTHSQNFKEYSYYIDQIKSGGFLISDCSTNDLIWNLENVLSLHKEISINGKERYGYAGKNRKVASGSYSNLSDTVNILKRI